MCERMGMCVVRACDSCVCAGERAGVCVGVRVRVHAQRLEVISICVRAGVPTHLEVRYGALEGLALLDVLARPLIRRLCRRDGDVGDEQPLLRELLRQPPDRFDPFRPRRLSTSSLDPFTSALSAPFKSSSAPLPAPPRVVAQSQTGSLRGRSRARGATRCDGSQHNVGGEKRP